MHANFPWLLNLNVFAHLGGNRPAHLLGFAAAYLLRNLLAFLYNNIFALLLGDRYALLLLVDATNLLGEFLARLVATLGQGNLNITANLGQGMAHLPLDLLADFLGFINANIFPDGSTDLNLLLMALQFRLLAFGLFSRLLSLLGSQRIQDMSNLVADRTLPLLGRVHRLRALFLADHLALLLLHLMAD